MFSLAFYSFLFPLFGLWNCILCGIYILCLPFVFLKQKGRLFFIWTGIVILNRSSDFLSHNGQMGSLLVLLVHSVDKIIIM